MHFVGEIGDESRIFIIGMSSDIEYVAQEIQFFNLVVDFGCIGFFGALCPSREHANKGRQEQKRLTH